MSKNSKEEVTELYTDMKWIKQHLKDVSTKVDSMHETFLKGEGKINSLRRRIYGDEACNGLIKKVDYIEKYIEKLRGGLNLVKVTFFIFGSSIVSLLYFIYNNLTK